MRAGVTTRRSSARTISRAPSAARADARLLDSEATIDVETHRADALDRVDAEQDVVFFTKFADPFDI